MSSAASNKRKRPLVQHRKANRRLVLVLVVSSVMLWATNAVTMSRASAAPQGATTTAGWTPDVGLALVLHGRLEILRNGRETVVSSSPGIAGLSWSSDGHWLAFERPYRNASSVWVVRVNGSNLRELASGAIVCYRWSTTGDILAFATSSGGTHSVRAMSFPSGRSLLEQFGDGEVGPIVASGNELAFGESYFSAGVGFTQGSLLVEPLNGAKSRVDASSKNSSYDPLAFSPDGKTLLYAIDPVNSASIAADGLQVRARTNMTERALGIALVDPGSWSWSPDSADLAITLGSSRAVWATDKHVHVCDVLIGHCREQRSPAGTISFSPSYGSAGRFAYVTATSLGGPSGFGKGAPTGTAVGPWKSTFRVWASAGVSSPKELTSLGAADDPQWVDGGPGLLVERFGGLCYLRSTSSAPTCFTPRFLALGFGNYGQFDWSTSFALAPR
jgi:hypothetical protein